MCGIVGAFGPSARRLEPGLADALASIAHRGPDGEGKYLASDGVCLLGHRRLAILDLSSAAAQPFLGGETALAYNGEIYNHPELRWGEPPPGGFRSHSDTETLSWRLRRDGVRCLEEAEGMFAGAFYDERSQALDLFRDPLGIKPLYFATLDDSTLVFASEIKALLSLSPCLARASLEAVATYMTFENLPPGRTLFQRVALLPPGAAWRFTLRDGKVTRVERQLPFRPTEAPSADLAAEARARIESSVRSHLLSDVPLAVYLSGGIDSGLVTAIAARERRDLVAFTGYFEETEDEHYDETPLARQLAGRLGIAWHEVPIRPADLERDLDAVVRALDEPRMGMGSFPQYQVAREAARHRKVILAGHGGDELFAGYPLFKAFWIESRWPSAASLASLVRSRAKEWPWIANHAWHSLRRKPRPFAPRLFRDEWLAGVPLASAFEARPEESALEGLRRYYHEVYLPGLLVVEDKISMAHGLETRVPLWSRRLTEWASRIRIDDLLPGGALKGLLRRAAKDWLPDAFFRAPKRGFPTPLRLWFRGPLSRFVRDRLLDRGSDLSAFVGRRRVESLIRSHEKIPLPFALDERRAHRLWILLCLESWSRQFKIQFGG